MFTLPSRRSLFFMLPIIFAVIAFVHTSLIPVEYIATATVEIDPSVTADMLRGSLRKEDGKRLLIKTAGPVASISASSPNPREATYFLEDATETMASTPLITENREILEREHRQNSHNIAVAKARHQELSASPDVEHAEEYVFLTNEVLDLENKNSRIAMDLNKNLITPHGEVSERVNHISVRSSTFKAAFVGLLAALVVIFLVDGPWFRHALAVWIKARQRAN